MIVCVICCSDYVVIVVQEVARIRKEHPDDSMAIANDRVKGSLKVTRAFGAGFLKQVYLFIVVTHCNLDSWRS